MIKFDGGMSDPDGIGQRVLLATDDPADGLAGRIVGWLDSEICLVMWPGNDVPDEEVAADLVAAPDNNHDQHGGEQ